MENHARRKTQLRNEYTKLATAYTSGMTTKERQAYIIGYNQLTGQSQKSLPRIFVKLMIDEGLTLDQVKPYIRREVVALMEQRKQARLRAEAEAKIKADAERLALEVRNEKSKKRKMNRKRLKKERQEKARGKPKVNKSSNVSFYLKTPIGTEKIKGNQVYMDGLEILFIEENLELLFNLANEVHSRLPRNFKFSLGLVGDQYKGEELKKSNERCFRGSMTSKLLDTFENEIVFSKNLGLPSDYYWIIKKIEINYEADQGGERKRIKINSITELNNYNVFNPDTTKNCGKMVLALYLVDCETGFISFEMMTAKLLSNEKTKHIKAYKFFDGFTTDDDEFILLYKYHWMRCMTKEKNKNLKKLIKINKIATFGNPDKKMDDNLVIVWDIESQAVEKNQVPFVIGFCSNENNFDFFYGNDCVKNFVELVISGNIPYIVGYNSGRYDYLLIRNELIRRGCFIQEIPRGSNDIIKSIVKYEDREYYFIDLLNFTNGNLKDNLIKYKCSCSKGEIDYSKIGYDLSSEFKENLIEYLKCDVVGTYQLLQKINNVLLKTSKGILDKNTYTLSQLAFGELNKIWEKAQLTGEFEMTKPFNKRIADFFRRASYGGRCEVFKREYKCSNYQEIMKNIKNAGEVDYNSITDYMRALDQRSMYPNAMRNCLYPVGDMSLTGTYKKGLLGIYVCDIIKPKNLLYPVSSDKKYNSYNLFDVNNECYTSVDIEEMRKYGYEVKIHYGYYWKECAYIFKEYIDKYYEIKKNCIKDTPEYLQAKDMINHPFGKCLQNDDKETNYICRTQEDIITMYGTRDSKEFKMNYELDLDGELTAFYTHTHKKNEEDLTNKRCYLGAFILSYSKQSIYNLLKNSSPYYTDTDSLYVENKYSNLFKIGKELGEYGDDIDGKIIYASFCAKKLKYVEYITPSGEFKVSYTGKGCYKKTLTKRDFKKMLKGLSVENKHPSRFFRNKKTGNVKIDTHISNIVMNDSNRYWSDGKSYPFGYISI